MLSDGREEKPASFQLPGKSPQRALNGSIDTPFPLDPLEVSTGWPGPSANGRDCHKLLLPFVQHDTGTGAHMHM